MVEARAARRRGAAPVRRCPRRTIGGGLVLAALVVAAPDAAAEARFGRNGFGITDAGENNTLWLGMRLQPRFVLSRSGESEATDEELFSGTGFRVRRLQIMVDGRLARMIEYKLQVDLGRFLNFTDGVDETRTAQATILQDAWVNFHIVDAFQIAVGQIKVPYAVQQFFASGSLVFAETSVATDGFRYGDLGSGGFAYNRDVGAQVQGWSPRRLIEYQAGVFLGDGMNVWPPTDGGLLYAARLVVQPFGALPNDEADLALEGPRLALGLSGNLNRHPLFDVDGDRRGALNEVRVGGELRFMSRGLSVTSEVFYATELGTFDEGAGPTRRLGLYAQASYYFARAHLLPAVRYARLDPDLEAGDDALSTFEVALNVLLPNVATRERGDDLGHFGKVVLSYELDHAEVTSRVVRHLLTIGAQVEF
jgi:hypothetical protein